MTNKPDIEGAIECPWCKDITLVTKPNGEGHCGCGHFTGAAPCELAGNKADAQEPTN